LCATSFAGASDVRSTGFASRSGRSTRGWRVTIVRGVDFGPELLATTVPQQARAETSPERGFSLHRR
jgi:hypothetical protein